MTSRGRPRSDDLGPGPDPGAVLVALRTEPGLACLWGSWGANDPGGGESVLIMSRPRASSRDVAALDSQPTSDGPPDLVGGGWVGWLGYDAPNHFAFYDHLLRWRSDTRRWSFESLWTRRRASALRSRRDQLREMLATLPDPVLTPGSERHSRRYRWGAKTLGEFGGPTRARYLAQVEAAIELIRAGEIYQANICTRIGADFPLETSDAVRLFARAATALRPRYGAFIDGGERLVLSLSPELFVRRVRDQVTSSPIKGTWARDPGDPADDGAERLRHSSKDVAENVMILDLVRNDLGRVARPGTVEVEQLLSVAPHPGRLAPHLDGRRPATAVGRQRRTGGGDVPPGVGHRRPESARDASDRGDRGRPPGCLYRCHRHRRTRTGLDAVGRDSHIRGDRWTHRARRGWRRDGRLGSRTRVARMRAEGDAAAAGPGRPSAGRVRPGCRDPGPDPGRRRTDRDVAGRRWPGTAPRRSPGPPGPIGS